MKNLILLVLFVFPIFSISQTVKSFNGKEINFYGKKFIIPSSENDAKIKSSDILTSGKIVSSCPKKGCWVKIITNSEEVFVTFKDYSFFVPKEGIRGKEIVINGIIKTDTISISQLKHYAYDAGESEEFISKITHPKITKSIVADGVVIID
ncbi:MAG: DUF4920 domain-containing protein [Flavobacteriaceae bacterium]|nr:DUF4920 domain-containing protein [Flavobacteriaceae bacterium]